jgi:nitrite reductase (NO-forming)
LTRLSALSLLLAIGAGLLASACGDDGAGANDQGSALKFTLRTASDSEGLAFIGVGGSINGQRNPTLQVQPGDAVEVTLENGDGSEHNVSFPDFNVTSPNIAVMNASTTITFTAGEEDGTFQYFCTLAGHRQAGMEGSVQVGAGGNGAATSGEPATGEDIVRLPTDLPGPIGDRAPTTLQIETETIEVQGQLADGTAYTYWTFDGKVPGPFWRARVGDTVALTLRNNADSKNTHSIDLHAVNGPGGGATVTQVSPGGEAAFRFKALNPGVYIYHCATPSVANHIANGMYGLILIEPEGGLPPVDHEFYVAQGEVYSAEAFGTQGLLSFDHGKMLDEQPEYVLMNGAVGALTEQHPLEAAVGDTVRIYYGVGGPNLTSSFHVIGEIFDRVYNQGSVTEAPITNVQTTTVAPGGATIVEFRIDVPGRYILVDHALSRLERGAAGFLVAEGEEDHDIFHGEETAGSGH